MPPEPTAEDLTPEQQRQRHQVHAALDRALVRRMARGEWSKTGVLADIEAGQVVNFEVPDTEKHKPT